jgi:iron complex outermembrane receptor protein
LDNASYLGIASGGVPATCQHRVESYTTYNATLTYRGIKNLLNEDPPFTLNHDFDLGSGSLWDPRVADLRGRAFTLSLE